MFLIDTNVVSDARKKVPVVMRWLDEAGRNRSYLSVISVGEIEIGIAKLHRRDAAGGMAMSRWLETVRGQFADRILPVDERVAIAWGRIAAGRSRSVTDGLIAATAQVHGLTLATRNIRDFVDLGVPLVDPWAGA